MLLEDMYYHEEFLPVPFYQNSPYTPSVPQSQQVQNQIYFVLFTNNLIGLLMSEVIFDNKIFKVIKRFPSLKKLNQVLPSPSNMSFCLNFMRSKLNFFYLPCDATLFFNLPKTIYWCHLWPFSLSLTSKLLSYIINITFLMLHLIKFHLIKFLISSSTMLCLQNLSLPRHIVPGGPNPIFSLLQFIFYANVRLIL